MPVHYLCCGLKHLPAHRTIMQHSSNMTHTPIVLTAFWNTEVFGSGAQKKAVEKVRFVTVEGWGLCVGVLFLFGCQ